MFFKYVLSKKYNYLDLIDGIIFEDMIKGRRGSILVNDINNIPIVRSTTKYKNKVQKLIANHFELIKSIKKETKIEDLEFNNAMIELYTEEYSTMGFHSDQSLDLKEGSYICLFSCYNDIENLRTLRIKNKLTHEINDIILENNSIVIFSLDTNSKYLHKIILENNKEKSNWLGITFRLSKTFSKEIKLKLADEKETKEFYKMRSNENLMTYFKYPLIDYTISPSDLFES